MFKVVRDLLRYNREFALGSILTGIVIVIAALRLRPTTRSTPMCAGDASWAYPFGTTSRGQDTFWILTHALKNTLLFGFAVAIISRVISLAVGLIAGYKGGTTDRVLMSINDTFIVIPLFPLLILVYFVMRNYMSWALLALVMGCLGWAYDARLIRSIMMSLKTREFTRTSSPA
jgi:peptide/nickel transport system permease protein